MAKEKSNIFDEFDIEHSLDDKAKEEELETKVISLLTDHISMQEKFNYSSYREFYEILSMIDIKKLRANIKAKDMTRTVGRYDIIPMQHRVFSGMIRKLSLNVVRLTTLLNESDISSKQIDILQKLIVILFSTKETQDSFFEHVDEALGVGDGYCVTRLKNEKQKIVSGAVAGIDGETATYKYAEVKIKYPYMEYISVFDAIYADDWNLQAYCEHIPYSKLKKRFGLSNEDIEEIKSGTYIQSCNWNACKDVKVFYNWLLNMIASNDECCVGKDWKINYKNVADELDKWFSVEKNKKAELWNVFIKSDLWTFEISVANGKIVGYGDSTLPRIGWPLDKTRFIVIPGVKNWEWLYDISVEPQKQTDALISQLKDEHNLSSVRQFYDPNMIEWEEEDFVMDENKISNRNITRVELGNISAVQNNLNLIATIQNQANLSVWLNSVNLGGDGRVARVAGEITEKKNATDTRMASFIDNINSTASSVAQKMLCYLFTFCQDEIKKRLSEEDYEAIKKIKLWDLMSGIKIVFDSELVMWTKQANIDNIMSLLQYTGGTLNDPTTGRPIVFMDDLMKFVIDNKWFNGLVRDWEDYEKKLSEQQKLTQSAQSVGQIATENTEIPPELQELLQSAQAPTSAPPQESSPSIVL